jgi:hypothetical protein
MKSIELKFKVRKIVIVKNSHGGDHVSLICKLPGSLWPYTRDAFSLQFTTAAGYAEQYLRENLFLTDDGNNMEIPKGMVEVIDIEAKRIKWLSC